MADDMKRINELMATEVKFVKKFAYLPRTLDGQLVWLESYLMSYELKEVALVDEWGHIHKSTQWQETGETL